jgi:hypothetical protein
VGAAGKKFKARCNIVKSKGARLASQVCGSMLLSEKSGADLHLSIVRRG